MQFIDLYLQIVSRVQNVW